jgi:hypothetical protein
MNDTTIVDTSRLATDETNRLIFPPTRWKAHRSTILKVSASAKCIT